MGRIMALTNQKGGVGKTTTTVNLGAVFGYLGKKVLIIDIDAQGNASQGLGIDKFLMEKNMITSYDMMLNYTKDSSKYIVKTSFKNLDCIPASQHFVGFDTEYRGSTPKELVLKKSLENLRDSYDYILIDCPPSLSTITINGLAAADSVLIPVQSEFYALEGMTQLLNTIYMCKRQLNKKLQVEGVFLTMYNSNTNLSIQVHEEVQKYFENILLKTVIRRNIAIAEAPSFGQPVIYYNPRSNGTEDYVNLGKEILDGEENRIG